MQRSKSPPLPQSPSHCPKPRRTRRQPRQPHCAYLESQLRMAWSQTSSFAEPIYHGTQRLLPPKLDQHRVNLDLATLATAQAGLPQQPDSSVPPCPHCCSETAGKTAEALHLQLLKISLSTKRQELLAAWAVGSAKVKQTVGKHWGRYNFTTRAP